MTRTTWVVHERPNPSTDCFVRPWLQRLGGPIVEQSLQTPPSAPPAGLRLVFVRYLTPAWRAWVERHRDRIDELVYFIDDDVFSIRASAGLPWRYRLKLYRRAGRHLHWLERQGARGLTSSPWLAQRYAARWRAGLEVLPMRSPYDQPARPDPDSQCLFYHGSASHAAEHRWLRPVIEAVLANNPDARFEVIADPRVRRCYAGLPRVDCVPPMDWPAYRRFIQRPGRAIGLAPLLDTPFNAARAPTKRLDITAAGAAGVYARHPVYGAAITDGIDGRLCAMEADAWIRALNQLLADPAMRERLWQAAAA